MPSRIDIAAKSPFFRPTLDAKTQPAKSNVVRIPAGSMTVTDAEWAALEVEYHDKKAFADDRERQAVRDSWIERGLENVHDWERESGECDDPVCRSTDE